MNELNKWHEVLENIANKNTKLDSAVSFFITLIGRYEIRFNESLPPAITSIEDNTLIIEYNSGEKYFELQIGDTYSWTFIERNNKKAFGEENLNMDDDFSDEMLEKLNYALT